MIGWVAAIDTYWSIKLQDILVQTEQNPIGVWLIHKDEGSVALFMGLKFAGVVMVLGCLVFLHSFNRRLANVIISGVWFFQVVLLWYLYHVP